MGAGEARRIDERSEESAPETDAARTLLRAELDIGDLRSGNEGLVTPFVCDGQHVACARERRLDPLLEIVTIRVIREFDVDLAGGLRHSDAYVHESTLPAGWLSGWQAWILGW